MSSEHPRRMTYWGCFARADHPEGWGQKPREDREEARGRAHGYSLLYVSCADERTLFDVADRLRLRDFHGNLKAPKQYSAGWLGEWFGGRFDHVATFLCETGSGPPHIGFTGSANVGLAFCRGDNRMVAVFDAREILEDEEAVT